MIALPIATPYERQMAVEALHRYVRRWGAARVAASGARFDVHLPQPAAGCAGCTPDERATAPPDARCLGCRVRDVLQRAAERGPGITIEPADTRHATAADRTPGRGRSSDRLPPVPQRDAASVMSHPRRG